MNIVFRADASGIIGVGHVMRCLNLAHGLKSRGAACHFVCKSHVGSLASLIRSRGFLVYELSADASAADLHDYSTWLGGGWEHDAEATNQLFAEKRIDWLVVDHYGIDYRWEETVSAEHRLVIDDLANRPHQTDLLLDQNWFGLAAVERYQGLLPEGAEMLLGPSWALLGDEYRILAEALPPREGEIRRILIFMGGGDPENVTAKVLEALTDSVFNGIELDVVLGVNHPDPRGIRSLLRQRKGARVHQGLSSLSALMVRADLMIGAGGATTWERMSLGLPSIVISIAKNQLAINRALSEEGLIEYLGESDEVTAHHVFDRVVHVISDPDWGQRNSAKIKSLVNGGGVSKVVELMLAKGSV